LWILQWQQGGKKGKKGKVEKKSEMGKKKGKKVAVEEEQEKDMTSTTTLSQCDPKKNTTLVDGVYCPTQPSRR
jgi:hypothetical protein